jgi:hypothetical protein
MGTEALERNRQRPSKSQGDRNAHSACHANRAHNATNWADLILSIYLKRWKNLCRNTHNCHSYPSTPNQRCKQRKRHSLQKGVVENVQGKLRYISRFPKFATVKSQSMYAVTAVCVVSRIIHQKTRSLELRNVSASDEGCHALNVKKWTDLVNGGSLYPAVW